MLKRSLTHLLVSVSCISFAATADDITVEPPISDVVVYRDGGATVTRRGVITLPQGQHTLTINKLTEALIDERVSLSFNHSDIRLHAMDLDFSYSETPASERQALLNAKLDELEEKERAITAEEQAKAMQLSFLRSLNQKTPTGNEGLAFEDWKNAIAFVGQQASTILGEIESLKKRRKSIKVQKDAIQRELSNTGLARQDYKVAKFDLLVPTRRDVVYELSYFVDDARWSLGLEGALDTDKKSLKLNSKAIISQHTGEDWSNVSLGLSNTAPSGDLGEIDQHPRFLSLTAPNETFKADHQRVERAIMPTLVQSPKAANMEEIYVTGTRVSTSSTAFDRMYRVSELASIPSSGEEEFIDLASDTSEVSLVVRSNPSADKTAFLFADTNLQDFDTLRSVEPILRRDGHFVGSGQWPDLVSNTNLELPYGADPAISVDYIEQAPDDGDSGLFGRNKAVEKRFLITVTNNHSTETMVEIFDQVPVAGHEDITVKILSASDRPTKTDMNGKQGLMMWRKTLAPGEQWKIKHQYRIIYPADMRLEER